MNIPNLLASWFSASGILIQALTMLLFGGCLAMQTAGCVSGEMTPAAFDQAMMAGDKMLTAAKELGLEADLQGGYTGKGGIGYHTAVEIDLGLQVMFHAKNNPAMHLLLRQMGMTEKLIEQNQRMLERLMGGSVVAP